MNSKILATTIAVLMSASALPVLAQDANVGASVDASGSVTTPAGDASATTGTSAGTNANTSGGIKAGGTAASGTTVNANSGGTSADASGTTDATAGATTGTDDGNAADDDNSFAAATAAVSESGDIDLSAVIEETQVTIVLLSTLVGDVATEGPALESAINAATAGNLVQMHANVEGNEAIVAQLEAEGFTPDDVVAIKVTGEDSVIVYVDDRA